MMKVNNTHKGIWYFLTKVKYVRRIFGWYLLCYVHFMFKEQCIVVVSYYFYLLRFEDGNLGYAISLTWKKLRILMLLRFCLALHKNYFHHLSSLLRSTVLYENFEIIDFWKFFHCSMVLMTLAILHVLQKITNQSDERMLKIDVNRKNFSRN